MAKLSIECLEDRIVPAVIFNADVPISRDVVVPKTGDTVHLSGTLHIVLETTVDSAGGIHFMEHIQPQGVSGVDLTTGAKYQGTGVTQVHTIVPSNGAGNFTLIDNFRIIGQGPDNNYTVHETLHFTTNANGDMTAAIANVKIDQGSGG
jgi:hypothetical protein